MITRIALKNFRSLDVDFTLDPVKEQLLRPGELFTVDLARMIAGCSELNEHCTPDETGVFLEDGMKGAKGWIERHTRRPYKPTRHQDAWASKLDLEAPLLNDMRSFKRLCHALEQLVHAVRDGVSVCTP